MATEPKPRVLIVDDNLEMARTIADGLEDHGYEAVALGSGCKAVEWMSQQACDALVTDLRMAGMDGLHERGAFTGASANRKGLFAEADGGTLFLNEIGDMPLALQAKLLHVLEAQTIRPVGSNKEQKVDVRILAATHRDLRSAVHKGSFREDLFYRLDVVSLTLPALRHRREDIPERLEHFLREQKARHPSSKVEKFSAEALSYLLRYHWPGNVRELAHLIERAVILGRDPEVPASMLPKTMINQESAGGPTFEGEVLPMRELQRRYAAWALVQLGGNKRRTAEKLDMDHKTLAKLVAEEEEPTS